MSKPQTTSPRHRAAGIVNVFCMGMASDTMLGLQDAIEIAITDAQKPNWQPIETAPEDQSIFVTWKSKFGDNPIYTARKCSVYKVWKTAMEGTVFTCAPEYWMPTLETPHD